MLYILSLVIVIVESKKKNKLAPNGQVAGIAIGAAFTAMLVVGFCVYAVVYFIRHAFPEGTNLYR